MAYYIFSTCRFKTLYSSLVGVFSPIRTVEITGAAISGKVSTFCIIYDCTSWVVIE